MIGSQRNGTSNVEHVSSDPTDGHPDRECYQRLAAALLANWRDVEWQLMVMFPVDPPEAAGLRAKAHWLRAEYEELTERARDAGAPELPPLPTEVGPGLAD